MHFTRDHSVKYIRLGYRLMFLNLRRDSTYTRSEPLKISYLLINYMGTNQSVINISYRKGFVKFMAELSLYCQIFE